MKTFKIIYLFIVSCLFIACKQDQYYLFNDVGRLQFGPEPSRIYTSSYNLADTLKRYTFVYAEEGTLQDTVFFDLYAIGGTSNVDRPFKLVQEEVPGVENAVAGKHYKAFDHSELSSDYIIKSNTVHKIVPIVLLRDPSLKQSNVILKLKVVPNDHFKEGEVSNLWRKVEFTDKLSQPTRWDANTTRYYLGKYSQVKHKFLIDSSGEKWDNDFVTYLYSNFAILTYWVSKSKLALTQYNAAHPGNPLRDEDGELVVFP